MQNMVYFSESHILKNRRKTGLAPLLLHKENKSLPLCTLLLLSVWRQAQILEEHAMGRARQSGASRPKERNTSIRKYNLKVLS